MAGFLVYDIVADGGIRPPINTDMSTRTLVYYVGGHRLQNNAHTGALGRYIQYVVRPRDNAELLKLKEESIIRQIIWDLEDMQDTLQIPITDSKVVGVSNLYVLCQARNRWLNVYDAIAQLKEHICQSAQ